MNLLYVKTFLEIVSTRNFYQASKNLNIAQSTASARIIHLEGELGHTLFHRSRAGFEITAAGLKFQKHALNLIRSWEQAQHSMGLSEEHQSIYRICIQINLWELLISNWIPWIRNRDPTSILELETEFSVVMMDQLSSGLLDIGVMYTPRKIQGLIVEQLLEEHLIMVSTDARRLSELDYKSYVFVNWGSTFEKSHNQKFGSRGTPNISVGMGPIALKVILDRGGSCYQSLGMVQSLIDEQKLFVVEDAPIYPRPVYMVYPDNDDEINRLQLALDGFRHVAGLLTN